MHPTFSNPKPSPSSTDLASRFVVQADAQVGVDFLLEVFDVGNDANDAVFAAQGLECIEYHLEAFAVEAAESFIEEEEIVLALRTHLHVVGEGEGKGKRGLEGLSTG